jgi:hypothetical protein
MDYEGKEWTGKKWYKMKYKIFGATVDGDVSKQCVKAIKHR